MAKRPAAKERVDMQGERSLRLLAFDPTPAGLIGDRSLRLAFKGEWARIRQRHFKEHGLDCEICGVVETEQRLIHAHEVYSYPCTDTVNLERILFICTRCHDAIHLERTRVRCQRPYIEVLEQHYCKVNGGISLEDLQADCRATVKQGFALREFYGGAAAKPKIDFGAYQAGVNETLRRRSKRPPASCRSPARSAD